MKNALLIFWRSLRRNWRQFLLYSVGVSLSVASVLLVGSLSQLAFSSVDRELDSVIFNGVEICLDSLSPANADDLVHTAARKSHADAMPYASLTAQVGETVCAVSGVDTVAEQMYSLTMKKGAFFTRADIDRRSRVCVIGETMAHELSPHSSCVGNVLMLTVNGVTEPFRIAGVCGSGYIERFSDVLDEKVYIPYTVAQQLQGASFSAVYQVEMESSDGFLRFLDECVGPSGYQLTDLSAQRQQLDRVFDTVTTVLSLLTGVSVVVAVVNMLVITWIHVKNSYKEIGLKKSLGASRWDILLEYVTESVGIACIGSVLGVSVNLVFCLVMNLTGHAVGYGAVRTAWVVLAVTGLSALFGLIPSYMASRLQPIDTIRKNG